jgi:hypothetical protein
VILAILFRRAGLFSDPADAHAAHPGEVELPKFLGFLLTLAHGGRLRDKVVVSLTAMTVMLSAIVGWWYVDANAHANEATLKAFSTELQLNRHEDELAIVGSAVVGPALDLILARTRCAFASQAAAMAVADGTNVTRERQGDVLIAVEI